MAALSPLPKMQFFDANGDPLVGGKLYTYAAGTTTPLATYTSSSGAVSNANPIILDSRGEANVWLAFSAYKFKLTTAADVEIWTVDNIAGNETFGVSQWLTSVAGTNTITATLASANFAAYAAGQMFSFTAANTITGAVTLDINGLGAKQVTKTGNVALIANDILAGQVVTVVYDGTRFQVVNRSNLAAPGPIGSTTASTGTFTTLQGTDVTATGSLSVGTTSTFSGNITASGVTLTVSNISSSSITTNIVDAATRFGYGPTSAGIGGAVTQSGSRATGVTINNVSGRITLFSSTASAGSTSTFTVTNDKVIGVTRSVVLLSLSSSGASTGVYNAFVSSIGTGTFNITVHCISAPAANDAPIINFAVVGMVAS